MHLLSVDKGNEAARKELNKLHARRFDSDDDIELTEDDMFREAFEIDYPDDDDHHIGNLVPCKFHNRGVCRNGEYCRFMHAPDLRSVRDEL